MTNTTTIGKYDWEVDHDGDIEIDLPEDHGGIRPVYLTPGDIQRMAAAQKENDR